MTVTTTISASNENWASRISSDNKFVLVASPGGITKWFSSATRTGLIGMEGARPNGDPGTPVYWCFRGAEFPPSWQAARCYRKEFKSADYDPEYGFLDFSTRIS
jgi:hypothetical protein